MSTNRRRRMRVLRRRAARTLRRHHFTFLSAGVLGAVLAVTMTSGGFKVDDGSISSPVAAAAEEHPSATPPPSPTPPAPAPDPVTPRVIYYIVESAEQALVLHVARRGDILFLSQQGLPPFPPTQVYYVMYETPEEELAGQRLLYELALHAPYYGLDFAVVDLRQ